MNLSGPMVMNVCVFSMVRLWPSSACHRLYSRWRSLLIKIQAAATLTNTIHVICGEGGEEVFFFQVLVESKFSLLYFEEIMFVQVYSALRKKLICNMSNKNKVRLNVFLCFSTDLESEKKQKLNHFNKVSYDGEFTLQIVSPMFYQTHILTVNPLWCDKQLFGYCLPK